MATQTVASDHTSATDELVEKKENEEAIGEKTVSLSNENEDKHDKAQDAQGPAPPLSTTKEEAEREDKKVEPAVVEVEKTDNSGALEDSVAHHLKEEDKEIFPDPQATSVTEPVADAATSQPKESPPTEPTVKETPQQPEMESAETEEEVQLKEVDIPEASAETIEKSINPVEVVKETEISETSSQKVEGSETVVTKVQEKSEEPEKEQEEQQKTVADAVPEPSAETIEKPSDSIEEKTRELEFDAEVVKETSNYETGPTETEKLESVVTKVEDHPSEPDKQSLEKVQEEQPEMVINETAAESVEKAGDIVEVQPPKESDIEVVKETGNSDSESVPVEAEKPELVSTEVEEKPREQSEVDEEVEEKSKGVKETKQELVGETAKSEGTSDDIIKDPISLKEENTDKEEEISVTGSTAQVPLNEEARAAPANAVESSPVIAAKVVEEEGKKDSICIDEVEEVSKEVVGVLENPEHVSVNQEAKTDLKEEREDSPPPSVEEKVAGNDDKKELGAPNAVKESSREAEVEIKKAEEQNEAKITTTEEGGKKAENVKDDQPEIDNDKGEQAENKVDERATAASVPVRETLASKFEEKEEESIKTEGDNLKKEQVEDSVKTEVPIPEPATKESDATKTSKDIPKETPAKPAQKQSNNIISKVKQSLVKAKKALTGKSPSSKNLSSETKGDIKVK